MKELSGRCGTMLRRLGVQKGDRVFLFLPRIPEFYIALAACAKIGAIIAPLYSEYRDSAVKDRMLDGQGKVIITTPQYLARVPVNELPDLHTYNSDRHSPRKGRSGNCMVAGRDGAGIRLNLRSSG